MLQDVTARTPHRLESFRETGELDTSYMAPDLARFRVNGFRQRGATSFAFRVIPNEIPRFEDLRLPLGVRKMAEEHRGLVLVTGATGSGKSTTLASLIGQINRTRRQHIVTIEDPIEFLHRTTAASSTSARSASTPIRSVRLCAARFAIDPDVILIGELRDAESAETAMQAAESGHLVFSTMHTVDASETLGRIVEFFLGIKQPQIRLDPGRRPARRREPAAPAAEGGGRVAAFEVMVTNARISELIRENQPEEIHDEFAEGAFFNMQTFGQSLIQPVLSGEIDRGVAADASSNKRRLPRLARARPEAAGRH